MPHVSSGGGGEELSSEDEIKVFQVEGEGEDEERSSAENLKEVKTSLVTEGEEKSVQLPPQGFLPPKNVQRADLSSLAGKPFEYLPPSPFGYVVSPYHPHHNGALGAISMVNRVPMVPPNHAPSPLSLMMYNAEAFQPPPAHMGIPQVHIDPKTGIPRPPVYTLAPPGQYHHPVFSPEFAQQFPWHPSSMYPMTSSFRTPPFPGTIPLTSNLPSKFTPPTLIPPHPGIPTHSGMSHHPLLSTGPKMEIPDQQESSHLCNLFSRHLPTFTHHPSPTAAQHHHLTSSSNNNVPTSQGGNSGGGGGGGNSSSRQRAEKKKSHIKKPLNAFMLYMKDMRSKVVQECTLKESAAINQILGRRWHNLSREEQSKYYEMARKERQLHMQLYPGWTARDNYAINAKKKKRKRDKSQDGDGNNPKKCRARFGLDQQSSWCKPCRRKKKCIRYISGSDNTAGESEDNIGSVGSSTDAAATPDPRLPNHHQNDNDDLTDDDDDNDSGNGDNDDDSELDVSSDFSLSSPPVPRPPSQHSTHPLNVQLLSRSHGNMTGSHHTADSLVTHVPPSDGFVPRPMPSDRLVSHMPLSEQFVSHAATSERLVSRVPPSDSPDMAQLPTPPSTDSSSTTSLSTPMLVVT